MEDNQPQLYHHHQPTASRLGLRNTGGEIVEVQGGHIVRSIGRKDRHSKVCTAKGPRDRRVRLSAHTAIQFYDVQDRLGYDRPSKAVDWLIKKAKAAIDELEELPPWNPSSTSNVNFNQNHQGSGSTHQEEEEQQQQHQLHMQLGDDNNQGENNGSFLPDSMDSDSIADTIKSFFPMGASPEANNSSAMQFMSLPQPDLLSRTSSQSEDLRLSLQSLQDPMLLHHPHNQQPQPQHHQNPNHQSDQNQTLFSNTTQMGFDGSAWSENQAAEIARFQRMFSWNSSGDAGAGAGAGAFTFNAPPLFGQTQLFSQRGPLQSSNTPSIRAWMDPPTAMAAAGDHHQVHLTLPFYQSATTSIGFGSSGGGFTRFRIPARIQGEEEEHDGISNKPSSGSSDSRH
ncbi:hypothetical protein LguiA_035465 [Lonicera macranthoides]